MARVFSAAGVWAIWLLAFAASAPAATVTVTTVADSGPGSLRTAVAEADAGDTIDFDASVDQIDLTSGAIAIDKALTISGPSPAQLTIDAGHNSRIFAVTAGDLEISGLTIANGAATGGSFVTGGAIDYVAGGALEISECAFTGNTAGGVGGAETNSGSGWGGAIHVSFSASSLTVSGCSFIANSAGGAGGEGLDSGTGRGGAINVSSTADNVPVAVSGSTFTANTAGGDGSTPIPSADSPGAAWVAAGALAAPSGCLAVARSRCSRARSAETRSGRGGSAGAVSSINRVLTVDASTFVGNSVGGDGKGGAISASEFGLDISAKISNSTLVTGTEGSYPLAIEASNGVAPDATQDLTLLVAAPDPPAPPIDPPCAAERFRRRPALPSAGPRPAGAEAGSALCATLRASPLPPRRSRSRSASALKSTVRCRTWLASAASPVPRRLARRSPRRRSVSAGARASPPRSPASRPTRPTGLPASGLPPTWTPSRPTGRGDAW